MKVKQIIVYYKANDVEGYRMRTVKYWFWQSKSLAIGRKIAEITKEFPYQHTITNVQVF